MSSRSNMCHAREREHPEYHDATRLAFRRFRRLPGLFRRFVVSHGWIPAFAGMTHAGLAGRDAAVVSRRRLTQRRLRDDPGVGAAPSVSQRSRLSGKMTRSLIVMFFGRVSMKRTASATSFGSIKLPAASASSILAVGLVQQGGHHWAGRDGADADAM